MSAIVSRAEARAMAQAPENAVNVRCQSAMRENGDVEVRVRWEIGNDPPQAYEYIQIIDARELLGG